MSAASISLDVELQNNLPHLHTINHRTSDSAQARKAPRAPEILIFPEWNYTDCGLLPHKTEWFFGSKLIDLIVKEYTASILSLWKKINDDEKTHRWVKELLSLYFCLSFAQDAILDSVAFQKFDKYLLFLATYLLILRIRN